MMLDPVTGIALIVLAFVVGVRVGRRWTLAEQRLADTLRDGLVDREAERGRMSDDDLDDLIEAWKRGEVEVVEPDPVTRARLMDALNAGHPKEINEARRMTRDGRECKPLRFIKMILRRERRTK